MKVKLCPYTTEARLRIAESSDSALRLRGFLALLQLLISFLLEPN